jgi:hypothetical protein
MFFQPFFFFFAILIQLWLLKSPSATKRLAPAACASWQKDYSRQLSKAALIYECQFSS